MKQHDKHTWLRWDEKLVYVRDETRGDIVFKPEEDGDRDTGEFERGFIAVSNDREVFLEDSKVFACEFEHQSPVHDLTEIGVYNEYGQLLINIKHH